MPTHQQAKIKVAFYNFFHGGGIGEYTHELLKRLHKQPELDVRLYCPPNFHWLKKATYPVYPILFRLSSPTPLFRRIRFLMAQYLSPTRFLRSTTRQNVNILHFSNINHFSYPFWQGKHQESGLKMACTAHDIKRSKAILNQSYESEQLKAFYRDCDLLFVHSNYQRHELIQFTDIPTQRIHKIPIGPFTFGLEDGGSSPSLGDFKQSTGLFFGNIRDEKNLDGLLYALAKCPPNIRLVVAGRPAGSGHRPIEYYTQLAHRLNINHRIDWQVRFIPDNEVLDLFKKSDWVALPYLPTFSSQSAVFNIATHFHKPILSTPTPSFTELLATYPIGVLAKDLTPQSIGDAINEIAIKSKKPDQFQFNQYLDEHTWEKNAKKTTRAYLSLFKDT